MSTKPTIKLNSTGDAVKAWQKIVGVTVDGIFGPATETATKKYQTAHNLKADGIVGTQTWATTVPSTSIMQASMFSWITFLPLWSQVAAGVVIIGSIFFTIKDKRK